jgi:hypothetical protein
VLLSLPDFGLETLIEVVQVRPPPTDACMPAKHAAFAFDHLVDRRVVLASLMPEREEAGEVASAEGLV